MTDLLTVKWWSGQDIEQRNAILLIALFFVFVQAGYCLVAAAPPQSHPLTQTSPDSPISEDDCVAYAQSIEASVLKGDADALRKAIDYEAIVKKALATLQIPTDIKTEFVQASIRAYESQPGMISEIIRQVSSGGSYRFLRVCEKDGQKTVLFRQVGEPGINYHEYFLTKSEGETKAIDVYVYLWGERLSESTRRFARPLEQSQQKSADTHVDYRLQLDQLKEMAKFRREGRFEDVLQVYSRLPDEFQRDKAVLMVRHQAAISLGDDELKQAVQDFRRYWPNDVCVLFLSIDYFRINKQYSEALEAIGQLDTAVGGDSFLDSIRADVVYKQGDAAKAYQLAEHAIRVVPDIVNCYWTFLNIALQEKDYDRVLTGLEQLEDQFEIHPGEFYDDPNYEEFLMSPQGQEWKRRHPRQ